MNPIAWTYPAREHYKNACFLWLYNLTPTWFMTNFLLHNFDAWAQKTFDAAVTGIPLHWYKQNWPIFLWSSWEFNSSKWCVSFFVWYMIKCFLCAKFVSTWVTFSVYQILTGWMVVSTTTISHDTDSCSKIWNTCYSTTIRSSLACHLHLRIPLLYFLMGQCKPGATAFSLVPSPRPILRPV